MTKQMILQYFCDINMVYNDSGKYDTLVRMLDELLKEQEAKLVTVEDALGSLEAVYFESCGGVHMWVDACLSLVQGCAELKRFDARPMLFPIITYGKTWRCWDKKPTDEQRKAVKWD